jgi:transcriptional regulator with XRE-family HTH domain
MFGSVLRNHRIAAGLTQDQLADRARLSTKAISALERGARRRPYAATVSALAESLSLSGLALAEFRTLAIPSRPASARRQANSVADFADRADATYLRMPHGSWMRIVGSRLDDARAAITWALGDGNDPDVAGRIIGGLRGVWRTSGLAKECRQWVEATLPLLDARKQPAMVSRVYRALAQASTGFRRVEAALRSKTLAEFTDDRVAIAASDTMLTEGLVEMGYYAAALETLDQNALLIEGAGFGQTLLFARTFYDRSLIYRAIGQTERIAEQLKAAMKIAGVTGDDWIVLDVRAVSADLAFDEEKHTEALSVSEEALQHARHLGWDVFVVSSLNSIAGCQLSLNRVEKALTSAADALALSHSRDALGFYTSVQHLARIAVLRGRAEDAALLHGFVEASLQEKTYVRTRTERKARNAFVKRLRGSFDRERLEALSRAGRSLNEDAVADLALEAASA